MKGVSVRGHLRRKDGEEKRKDKEDSEDESSNESELPSRIGSPMPAQTPMQKGPAPKGWSTMLDGRSMPRHQLTTDWFCGPPPKSLVAQSPNPDETSQTLSIPQSPSLNRSSSAPIISPSDRTHLHAPQPSSRPQPIPNDHLAPGHLHPSFGSSPLSRSESSLIAPSDSSSDSEPPPLPEKDIIPSHGKGDNPDVVLTMSESARTGQGSGCYVHLVKERLMGMYLSIYIYKGCEHLVQGVDKDFVTAGLAGGRLGNKGGM
jgi:hypothetical protein